MASKESKIFQWIHIVHKICDILIYNIICGDGLHWWVEAHRTVPPKPIIPKHPPLYQSTPTHTHTTMHKHSQTCTPAHTFAHPHVLPDTPHTYPLLILLSLNVFGQVWTNHSYLNRPNTKKRQKERKTKEQESAEAFQRTKKLRVDWFKVVGGNYHALWTNIWAAHLFIGITHR